MVVESLQTLLLGEIALIMGVFYAKWAWLKIFARALRTNTINIYEILDPPLLCVTKPYF